MYKASITTYLDAQTLGHIRGISAIEDVTVSSLCNRFVNWSLSRLSQNSYLYMMENSSCSWLNYSSRMIAFRCDRDTYEKIIELAVALNWSVARVSRVLIGYGLSNYVGGKFHES